jgi:hypothetical protein
MELSNSERHNLNWLYSVLAGNVYTKEFKVYALKNIEKIEKLR